ncbi:hypothetical protein N5K21_10495 [Rhizobium pusense]|uniref:PIN domain-containing protein n=1 Tax=Agrobacterium pusense TaxID=648995 RepID=A0A6H0ZSW8_9HYPH|nr:hypothetical protein [Agrobacterium pusense]MDH2089147.1 hypothetical protein [Agrobacterium pusense]QIX23114.1 hypothetical protein FOB41_18195 [Agrobacterium pusense]WCK27310.1 hypothetical protein CFBP5496_0024280 [Agrobacterium pusense]
MIKQRRILLDSNIWRYISDAGFQGRLLRIAPHGNVTIQIAPAIMYEALRLRDAPLRRRLVELMANQAFHRLMPEAFSESMEILNEIKRLRPEWLRQNPNLAFFDRSRKDWSRKMGGFWVRCANSPDHEAGYIAESEGSLMDQAEQQILETRSEMLATGWNGNLGLDQIRVTPKEKLWGWNGEPVEAWRWSP